MGLKSITSSIENYLESKGKSATKSEDGYYMVQMPECQLLFFPEVFLARVEVIPTAKKYHLHANKRLQTDFGTMYVDNNPNLSNPALVFGIVEKQLDIEYMDKVINYMVSNLDELLSN